MSPTSSPTPPRHPVWDPRLEAALLQIQAARDAAYREQQREAAAAPAVTDAVQRMLEVAERTRSAETIIADLLRHTAATIASATAPSHAGHSGYDDLPSMDAARAVQEHAQETVSRLTALVDGAASRIAGMTDVEGDRPAEVAATSSTGFGCLSFPGALAVVGLFTVLDWFDLINFAVWGARAHDFILRLAGLFGS